MADRPPARYGRQRLSRRARRWIIVGLTVVVLGIGVVVAAVGYHRLGRSEVSGTLASYRIVDDETVEVTISVTREDPSHPAVCIVRGKSKDGTETGRREVLIPPSTSGTVQVTTSVKTSRPPVMGDVYGCGLDVPGYLVAP
ncbi:MAG TPA: DUF4307 domain-containing protein [Mycobacterium sp.]|nr:DUF4307 domain-containing protein [Mycobacterium sp.]